MTGHNDVTRGLGFTLRHPLVHPDAQGRITLGDAVRDGDYRVFVNERGQILLDPVTAIPESERWLWQTPALRASMDRALEQASRNDLHDLGSFARGEPT